VEEMQTNANNQYDRIQLNLSSDGMSRDVGNRLEENLKKKACRDLLDHSI